MCQMTSQNILNRAIISTRHLQVTVCSVLQCTKGKNHSDEYKTLNQELSEEIGQMKSTNKWRTSEHASFVQGHIYCQSEYTILLNSPTDFFSNTFIESISWWVICRSGCLPIPWLSDIHFTAFYHTAKTTLKSLYYWSYHALTISHRTNQNIRLQPTMVTELLVGMHHACMLAYTHAF